MALARWYFFQGKIRRAYDNTVLARVSGMKANDLSQILLEFDCLMIMKKQELARHVIEWNLGRRRREMSPHLVLAMSNTYSTYQGPIDSANDVKRLEWINFLYERRQLSKLRMRDDLTSLGFDNLDSEDVQTAIPADKQPLVTVIVPAYQAERTLHIALDSLLRQTWRNLEIIVVDDASLDGTFALAEKYAAHDSRVIALRQNTNRGSYAARNAGLRRSSGEFITTHDSDDWSHPQKIEIQVTNLLNNPDVIANVTYWVRAFSHLYFRGTSRPSGQLLQWNHSSLLMRRSDLLALGGWDEIRVSADTELIRRLEHAKKRKIFRLYPDIPLSFALENPGTLTRSGHTHVRTLYHGVRREYHEAARHWLSQTESFDLEPYRREEKRPFPAPSLIRAEHNPVIDLDLLFIMDFNLEGGAYVSTMNYIGAAIREGYSVGVFHWRRYDLDVTRLLRKELRQMAQEGSIHIVTPGEQVRAPTVLVGYPVVLQNIIDLPPVIDLERFYIITNQMSSRLYSGGDVQYCPATVSSNVRSLFGIEPVWIPISGLVHELMEKDGRYQSIHPDIWTPLIDINSSCHSPLEWRGQVRDRPAVGRHARDHYTKWPATPQGVTDAYCAGKPCDVFLLGGATKATEVIGRLPENWNVLDFGSMNTRDFLDNLDFFIHYPHEDYIEEFGRSVIEAMAAGVPTILPPVFEKTFGSASLYADSTDVWSVVSSVWADENTYIARAQAGRGYVLARSGWENFRTRLERLSDKFPTRGIRRDRCDAKMISEAP